MERGQQFLKKGLVELAEFFSLLHLRAIRTARKA